MNHKMILLACTLVASVVTAADITWTGNAAPDRTWSNPDNWNDALGNPTADRIIFSNTDTNDTLAKVVDADWEVGGLRAIQNGGWHVLDIGGHTLTIGNDGDLSVQRASSSTANLIVSNGTLSVARDIYVNSGSTLIVTNATLTAPFRRLHAGQAGNGYIDLLGVTVAGGVLEVDDIRLGDSNSRGELYLGSGAFTTLKVNGNLYLNSRGWNVSGNQRGGARIGAPDPARDNAWYLPPHINIVIGSETSRGNLHIHYITSLYTGSDFSRLAANGGGDFEAWLDRLIVSEIGLTTGGHDAGSRGTLDLRGMDAFLLDVAEVRIGLNSGTRYSQGWVYLPEGTARVDRLYIGDSLITTSEALLDMSNTVFKIDELLDMKDSADIRIGLRGESAGLDLHTDAEIVVTDEPTITITFHEAPDMGVDPYWGIRQAGNHAAVIGGMVEAGVIDLVIGAFSGAENYKTGVYYDSDAGYTYAALVDSAAVMPPAISARDITVEVDGETAIRIGPDDLLLSSYNPESLEETGRTIAHGDYHDGTEQGFLDFDTTGTLPVTYTNATVTIYYAGGVSASDVGDVTFVTITATTGGNVTWLGTAGLQHDPRRAWEWGANWEYGEPPANPAATVTFADTDLDAAHPARLGTIPDWDGDTPTNVWTIASLRAGHRSGTHVLDLGGQTLRTTGEVLASRLAPTGSGIMVISNGTLEVGADLRVQNGSGIDLSGMGGTLLSIGRKLDVRSSTLTLDGGVVLDGRFEALDVAFAGTHSVLDLRGTTVTDGLLDLDELRIGGSNRNGELYLDTNTLHTLRIRHIAHFNGEGQRGSGHIGAPDPARGNAWYLPADINVLIGSETEPAELLIGITAGYNNGGMSRLAAYGDGCFEAWLTAMTVGQATGNSETAPSNWMDVRDMRELFMAAATVNVGVGDAARTPKGQVYLGHGTALFGNLTIGHENANANSIARLELNDTRCRVTDSLTAYPKAELIANIVPERGSGFEFAFLPSMPDGAILTVAFLGDPTHGELHYGLKIAGNVVDDLADALIAIPGDPQPGQWLLVDDDALARKRKAAIFHQASYTYLAVPRPGSMFLLK